MAGVNGDGYGDGSGYGDGFRDYIGIGTPIQTSTQERRL